METPRRVLRSQHLENVEQFSTPFKIPASPFMKSLGYGTGVNVFRLERSPKGGELRSPWAVKRTSHRTRTSGDVEYNARIQKEAEILKKLSHPNVVGFRGVSISDEGIHSLILECCSTSLGLILEERNEDNEGPLPPQLTRKVIRDVSSALEYLHTEAKLLHGDLKSFNVLIQGKFEICKLCDFGVSLPLDEEGLINFKANKQLKYVGTPIWSAPEVIDESDVIDCKADIFSFGLIIYETIALIPPHTLNIRDDSATAPSESENTSAEQSYLDEMDMALGTRPPLPQSFDLSEEYNNIVELFYCCTMELSEDRPDARTIWKSMEMMTEKETEKKEVAKKSEDFNEQENI